MGLIVPDKLGLRSDNFCFEMKDREACVGLSPPWKPEGLGCCAPEVSGKRISFSAFLFYAFRYICIVPLLILISSVYPSAGVQVNLSAPDEVEVCIPEAYEMRLSCDADAEILSASVLAPEGFRYAGGSEVFLGGARFPTEPSVNGRSLAWDLGPAARACRHVVVNEWEQNPLGQDGGKEWVELYNPSSKNVDISAWCLIDGYYGKVVLIPAGTVLSAGGYLVLNWTNGSLINSHLTSITLRDGSGREIDRTLEAKDEKDDDRCWARYPNGRDLEADLDWRFQKSTRGATNGGGSPDLYANETLDLEFNLTAGCEARSGQDLQAEVSTSAGSSSARTPPISVKRANLSLSALPDRYEAAPGDEVTWTIHLENRGDGTASAVRVNDTLGRGLQMIEIDSPGGGLNWSYASIEPGGSRAVQLRARAVSVRDYYNLVNASWGCGPCQQISILSELGSRTAIRKEPDYPRSFAIGDLVHYRISVDLTKASSDLWINDTVPKGLIYDRSSLLVQGPALVKEISALKEDGSLQVCWFFGGVGAAERIEIGYSALVANEPENQDSLVLQGENATMSWNGGLETDQDEAGDVTIVEPDLILEKSTSARAVDASGSIAYTLKIFHSPQSHAHAFGVELKDILPSGMNYSPGSEKALQGPEVAFDPLQMRWHLADIDQGWNSSCPIILTYNATVAAKPGDEIVNNASLTWTSQAGENRDERSGSGGVNDYIRKASISLNAMRLSARKTADPDPVGVGELIAYTLTYENEGREAAGNVTINDLLDPGVSYLSSEPSPSEGNGTWRVPLLLPDGPHRIAIKARVSYRLDNGTRLANRFSIQSDEIGPVWSAIYTDVLNGTRLGVNKTALQKAVRRGEEITYTIRVCNRGGQPATNVSVRDVFDSSVEFVSASPGPDSDGVWKVGTLDPGECTEISLTVRVPKEEVKFESHQIIKGNGFMRAYRDYTTALEPYAITNRAYVTSDQAQVSAEARVKVLGEEGTDLHIREHGSGAYEDREDLRFLSCNKSIRLNRSVGLHHHPIAFQLPGKALQGFSSLWSETACARNGITLTSLKESYVYSRDLNSSSRFDLDENGSKVEIEASSQGLARLGASKKAVGSIERPKDLFLSQEEYAGGFKIRENFWEGGRDVVADRSVSGRGYVASDHRVGSSQRSYESGTGNYSAMEEIQTSTDLMAKDIDVNRQGCSYLLTPGTFLNITQAWEEGMWSRSRDSFLGEDYFSAVRLKKRAVARGSKEMESDATFIGRAQFRAISGQNRSEQMDVDEVLLGCYHVKRKTILVRVSKYDKPHLTLSKEGRLSGGGKDCVVADYTITITNDGNVSLGPVLLRESFPAATRFLNSSSGPSWLGRNGSVWTFVHLPIGESVKIEVYLDVRGCNGDIINLAVAEGSCGSILVTAENRSVIHRAWLGNCEPAQDAGSSASVSCACSGEEVSHEASDETEYFDPVLGRFNDDSSCPLSCPAVDDAREDGS